MPNMTGRPGCTGQWKFVPRSHPSRRRGSSVEDVDHVHCTVEPSPSHTRCRLLLRVHILCDLTSVHKITCTCQWDAMVHLVKVGSVRPEKWDDSQVGFRGGHASRCMLGAGCFQNGRFGCISYSVSELRRAYFRQTSVARAVLPPGALFRAGAFALAPTPTFRDFRGGACEGLACHCSRDRSSQIFVDKWHPLL